MALKRWRWIAGPVLGALLVAIAVLPPRVPSQPAALLGLVSWPGAWYPEYFRTDSERSQFSDDVRNARWALQARLRHAVLAESILAMARGSHVLRSEDGVVSLVYERPLTLDSARFWLGAVTREMALYPQGSTPGMPLVVALLSDPVRNEPGNRAKLEWGTRELLDQTGPTGACVVTVNLVTPNWGRVEVAHDLARRPVSRLLGACALYARFGAPGPGASQWVAVANRYYWSDPLTAQLQEARRKVRRYEIPDDLDWRDSPWYGDQRWLVRGCLRGAAGLCARAAGLGPEPGSSFFSPTVPRIQVIAYLLATGTAEQFATFWHSSQPVAEALAAAYGAPASGLAKSAYEHWYADPGRSPTWGKAPTKLAGLVWAGLALALAVVAGRRWKTEP